MLDNESICEYGKAAFYAAILPELKKAAYNCGWAIALHGSLSSDMDIMAMPWTEKAKIESEFIKALSECFVDRPYRESHLIPYLDKPNNRVVYTMSIWADYYLDINIIRVEK